MKPVYVNSAVCISAQDTLNEGFFHEMKPYTATVLLNAIAPNYKDFIPPAQIRRMSKTVKMSAVAAHKSMQEAGIEMPDAIIVGTGMGCEEDSERFLSNVIRNEEEFLTPTHFIQSTHNTVAGQIALANSCHAYNFTYVNPGSSLEMSLLDAKLQLEHEEAKAVLVGATDEKSPRTMELYQLNGTIKKEADLPADVLNSTSDGVVWGEGSSFFVLGSEKSESTCAQLEAVTFINMLEESEVSDFISEFLLTNNLNSSDVDAVLLGFSGDLKSDGYYKASLPLFENSCQLYFKHLSGEFNTASGFAFFLANQILKRQEVPEVMKINKDFKKNPIRNILIYNHLHGEDHSLTLLKKA
ncbi:MAG: beta-ketoacyl synthase chain length factor [Weeksellaceae bacterium]|nr:beta-ketoacyl synthase chain length factor [Weeksellaceae bacterium]